MSLPQRLPPLESREEPRRLEPAGFRWNVRRAIIAALLVTITIALVVSFANTVTPAGIVIHHTGPLGNVTLASLDEFHTGRGFGAFYYGRIYHVGYHYIIFPDGRVVTGRPDHLRGAHTRHYNNYLGIVLVGDFSAKDNPRGRRGPLEPTEAQLSSLVLLCRRLEARYGIPLDHVYPHRALGRTLCPGNRFPWKQLLSRIPVQPQPHTPPLK